jgi:hypothetical protein
MTAPDYATMPAGEELDAPVGERVMWHVRNSKGRVIAHYCHEHLSEFLEGAGDPYPVESSIPSALLRIAGKRCHQRCDVCTV